MFEIGLSRNAATVTEEIFKAYADGGIRYMEVSHGHAKDYLDADYTKIKKWAEEYGITLWSYHIPFSSDATMQIRLESLEKDVREHTVAFYTEAIKRAADMGIGYAVIHPSTEPITNEEREEKLKYSQEGLNRLAEVADKAGTTLAVENLPRTCLGNRAEELLEIISVHPKLRVCFDTNHLLQESHVDFIRKVREKIVTLHVSDYDFIDERHLLPGEGKINWKELVELMAGDLCPKAWIHEINFGSSPFKHRDKELSPRDLGPYFRNFYKNL